MTPPTRGPPWAELRARGPGEGTGREPDHYAILGVDPHASDAAIALAYRREGAECARRPGSEAATRRLRRLNAAYSVLGAPARRAHYDRRRGIAPPRPKQQPSVAALEPATRPPPRPRGRNRSWFRGWEAGGRVELLILALVAGAALGAGSPVSEDARV